MLPIAPEKSIFVSLDRICWQLMQMIGKWVGLVRNQKRHMKLMLKM